MIKIFLLLLFVFLSTAAPAGKETVAERFGIHRLLKSTRRNTNSSIVHQYTPTNSSISDESLDDSSRRNLYASVTYRKHSGKDRSGGDISCGRYGSHQQLKDACSRNKRCIGYTVWGTNPWCLKTTSSRPIAHGHGHDFYEKVDRRTNVCAKVVDLGELDGDSATFSTTGAGDQYQTSCGGNGEERIFQMLVQPGYVFGIRQISNDYDSRHELSVGESCENRQRVIDCVDDPDDRIMSYTNKDGRPMYAFFVVDAYGTGSGTFTLNWQYNIGGQNTVIENANGVGGFGGSCTCPDGNVYEVGDNKNHCGSLACVGGTSGTCNRYHGSWSNRKVICAAD